MHTINAKILVGSTLRPYKKFRKLMSYVCKSYGGKNTYFEVTLIILFKAESMLQWDVPVENETTLHSIDTRRFST